MEPRLSSSRKWSAVPKEVLSQITGVFTKTFSKQAKTGKFVAEGRIYPQELLITIGFLGKDRLKQNTFEISIEYKSGKDDVLKLIYVAVDVAATMMDELFSAENDLEFPRLWKDYEVENRTVYLQYSGRNTDLEKQADQLLGEAGEGLVEGDDSEDELKHSKRILGLDPDDDDGNLH